LAQAILVGDEKSRITTDGTVRYHTLTVPIAQPTVATDDQGICAQVVLQIEQQAVVTRKGIGATLQITNNSATDPIQDLTVNLTVYDDQGNDVTDRFAILAPTLHGINVQDSGNPPPDYD